MMATDRPSLRFVVPGLPPSLNGQHGHFFRKAKERKRWRALSAQIAMGNKPPRPLVEVRLLVTRHSAVQMDYDNMVAASKPLVDGLRDAGIIWNDDPSTIIERGYLWAKAPSKDGHVVLEVSGVPASEEFLADEEEKRVKREVAKAKRLARKALNGSGESF